MIRQVGEDEAEGIYQVINDGAAAYRGVIPADCWHEPYMSRDELAGELAAGVAFWGEEDDGQIVGVMGRQDRGEVVLLRHAYVRTAWQRRSIGSRLLNYLVRDVDRPLLVGTWAAAHWAIRFYEQHGFKLVTPAEKDRLLRLYWQITDRQVETSVVLGDAGWWGDAR